MTQINIHHFWQIDSILATIAWRIWQKSCRHDLSVLTAIGGIRSNLLRIARLITNPDRKPVCSAISVSNSKRFRRIEPTMTAKLIRSTIQLMLTAPPGEIDETIRDRLRDAVEKPGLDDLEEVLQDCYDQRLAGEIVLSTVSTTLIMIRELRSREHRSPIRPRRRPGRPPRRLH